MSKDNNGGIVLLGVLSLVRISLIAGIWHLVMVAKQKFLDESNIIAQLFTDCRKFDPITHTI
jgi:hypothetical protein